MRGRKSVCYDNFNYKEVVMTHHMPMNDMPVNEHDYEK